MFFERILKKFLPCGFLREEVCIYIRRAWFLKKFQRDGFRVEQVFYILGCGERCVFGESFCEGGGVFVEVFVGRYCGMFLGGFEGLNGVDVGWRNVWLNLWYRITCNTKSCFSACGLPVFTWGIHIKNYTKQYKRYVNNYLQTFNQVPKNHVFMRVCKWLEKN